MPRIVFVEPGGARREINASVGISVMETALEHGVQGIVAQCGGACACATCHVYVAPAWFDKLPPPEEMEQGMLECAWQPRATSRLSCQIPVTSDMDGLELIVPQQQGAS
jgi:2Fe-2S ferredoxin